MSQKTRQVRHESEKQAMDGFSEELRHAVLCMVQKTKPHYVMSGFP